MSAQIIPQRTGTHDHSKYKQINAKSFKMSGIWLKLPILGDGASCNEVSSSYS